MIVATSLVGAFSDQLGSFGDEKPGGEGAGALLASMGRGTRVAMKERKGTRGPVVCVARYRRDQGGPLRPIAPDAHELEDTHEEWHTVASRRLSERKQMGQDLRKVDVHVQRLVGWGAQQGYRRAPRRAHNSRPRGVPSKIDPRKRVCGRWQARRYGLVTRACRRPPKWARGVGFTMQTFGQGLDISGGEDGDTRCVVANISKGSSGSACSTITAESAFYLNSLKGRRMFV